MAKKNEKNNEKNNEECTCGLCSGDGIGKILNMLASSICIDSNDMLGLSSGIIGMGMMVMGGELPCPDPECNRAKCQSYRWKKDDKVATKDVFKDDEAPALLIKLPHHREIESLISLKKHLAESRANQIVWKKIIEDHITEEDDTPVFEQLSDSSKAWLEDSARKALSAARNGGRSGKKVIKEVTGPDAFIEVLSGKKTYKNEAFNDVLKKIREIAVNSDETDIQKKIDRITAELPDDLKGATEIPTCSIPLELLTEENIKKFVELFKTS